MVKAQHFQQMMLEKLNIHMQKNEEGPSLNSLIQKLAQNGLKA